MHDIERMQRIAQYMYEDTDTRKWLFSHTYSADEYRQVRHALKVLAQFHPVQWTGKTGERRPVECNNTNCINNRYHFQHDEQIDDQLGSVN